jgi:hypothetical protein
MVVAEHAAKPSVASEGLLGVGVGQRLVHDGL